MRLPYWSVNARLNFAVMTRACFAAALPRRGGLGQGWAGTDDPAGAALAVLAETIAAALPAGDLHVARVAHEALGRLFAQPEPGAPSVADLASERAKRERKE